MKKTKIKKNDLYILPKQICNHIGNPIKIGPYEIYPSGTHYEVPKENIKKIDIFVPLTNSLIMPNKTKTEIIPYFMMDLGGVPSDFKEFLNYIIYLLKEGKKIMPYCIGSHGRTGTLLAGLIVLLEPKIEDPIEEIRKRHCSHSVESWGQVIGIFNLKGENPPKKYETFKEKYGRRRYNSGWDRDHNGILIDNILLLE